MEPISEAELIEAILAAAIPAIEELRDAHPNELFVGFAVETLAENGYFHLCAETAAGCQKSSEKRPYLQISYLLPEDISSNCQDWSEFDFNHRGKVWWPLWAPMRKRIDEYCEYLRTLGPDGVGWDFIKLFWRASLAAFEQLTRSDAVRSLPKGSCFVTFIYEHHDVF